MPSGKAGNCPVGMIGDVSCMATDLTGGRERLKGLEKNLP